MPGIERLFDCGLAGEQRVYLFVKVVVHKGEPRRPGEFNADSFRRIGIQFSEVLTAKELGRIFVGLMEFWRREAGKTP